MKYKMLVDFEIINNFYFGHSDTNLTNPKTSNLVLYFLKI